MSEENQPASEVSSKPAETKGESSVEELTKRLGELESSNKRLLNESHEWSEKYKAIRNDTDMKEKQELVKSKNWEELLQREKSERLKIEEQFLTTKKETLKHKLESQVSQFANDAHNVKAVIKILPSDMLQLNEDELTIGGVKEAVESLRKSDPYLFKSTSIPSMENKRPSSMGQEKSLSEMTRKEKENLLKQALSNV